MAVDTDASAQIAGLARALADPVRVQLLALLRERPAGAVCQCELQPFLGVSQPTLSHHLRKLQDAGLVSVERRGRWAYYSIDPDRMEVLRQWLS